MPVKAPRRFGRQWWRGQRQPRSSSGRHTRQSAAFTRPYCGSQPSRSKSQRKSSRSVGQTVGMQGAVPDDVESFVRDLTHQLAAAGPDTLVGVYVHGSAVFGDFQRDGSDVDILVVVHDGTPSSSIQAMARILSELTVGPGTGVEVSILEESAAQRPSPPWPYRVHVSTSPPERKTVWCEPGRGDSDLILHYAATRQAGWAADGPPSTEVVGEIGPRTLAAQLAAELRWAVD